MKKSLSASLPKLVGLILGATIALGAAGCAANLPNADAFDNEAFGLLASDGSEMADMSQGPGKHFKGPMMGLFIKELGLSADQQTRFKAIFAQVKTSHQDLKPQFQALRSELKQAFLSESFDAAALRARITQQMPEAGSHSQQMATTLIQAWQILTPEQQTKVLSRMDQLEQRMGQWQKQPGSAGMPAQHLQKMAQALQLSSDQQDRIKALWQEGQPDRASRMQDMKAVKTQVLAELRSPSPSADRLAAVIAPLASKGQGAIGEHLDKIAALHEILSPTQRQQLVTLLEQKSKHHGPR